MRRLLIPLSAFLAFIALGAPSAWAGGGDGNGGAGVGSGGITVTVGTPGDGGHHGGGGGGSSTPPPCGIEYISGTDMPSLGPNPSTEGYWMIDTCKLGTDPGALTWVPVTPGTAPPVASVAAQSALGKAPWPTLTPSFDPVPTRLLVNFPTWLHLSSGWKQITASATIAGVTATVTARPESVSWAMGDGTSVTCHSAGTAYDSHLSWQQNLDRRDCGYTYRTSSAGQTGNTFTVKVTIHYAVTWTSNFGGGGSLGGYDRSAQTSVTVGQVKSLEN
jgi:hypothetical protein